jgi:hypothetical protein
MAQYIGLIKTHMICNIHLLHDIFSALKTYITIDIITSTPKNHLLFKPEILALRQPLLQFLQQNAILPLSILKIKPVLDSCWNCRGGKWFEVVFHT